MGLFIVQPGRVLPVRKKKIDSSITAFLENVRKHFKIPIAVGFGISSKERVEIIAPFTDIIVTGSAIIDIINRSKGNAIKKNVKDFIENLMFFNV